MFGWLKRLFNIGKAEANAALDKLEDPVKMTEQGIKDLKTDLNKSLQSLAEVKAMAIREKKRLEEDVRASAESENKAILLLQKAESGELSAAEADRLASGALQKKEQFDARIQASQKNVNNYDQMVTKMEGNVNKLKGQISEWEHELKTLRARSKVSEATAKLNKQLAQADSSGTLARLERMKQKVQEQESLAESYGDLAAQNTSLDDEIDQALGLGAGGSSSANLAGSDALKQLKAKMASNQQNTSQSNSSENTSSGSTDGGANTSSGGTSSSSDELEKLKQKLRDQGGN